MKTFHAPESTPNLRLLIPSLNRPVAFRDGAYTTSDPAEIEWLRRSRYATEQPDDANPARNELYERAQQLDIKGRSTMDKDDLAAAVAEAEAAEAARASAQAAADAEASAGD